MDSCFDFVMSNKELSSIVAERAFVSDRARIEHAKKRAPIGAPWGEVFKSRGLGDDVLKT